MSSGLSANRKFLIAIVIGIIIGAISLLFWRIDQTISLGLLVVAMAIPIGVYLMYEDFIDVEDLLDEHVETHEEEHIPEVVIPEAPLTNLPIETIEGIGPSYGKMLRSVGIGTVADMMKASPEKVKEACGVTTRQAERWIAMSQFAWLDSISEEDAEAIVFATGMRELKKLASSDPAELLAEINKAVQKGMVEVPAGYKFTLEKVKAWIAEAKTKI
ncbi:MAG: DUF4332 domain-containing protein [Candidatus Thorarchaeota archaeon]